MSTIADRPYIDWHAKFTSKKTWFWYAPINDSHDLMIASVRTHWLMARLRTCLLADGIPSQRVVLTWIGDCVCGHLLCSNETLDLRLNCNFVWPRLTVYIWLVSSYWILEPCMHTCTPAADRKHLWLFIVTALTWHHDFSRAVLCISCSR